MKKKPKHSDAEKLCSALLVLSGVADINELAKVTGIHHSTLRAWRDKLGEKEFTYWDLCLTVNADIEADSLFLLADMLNIGERESTF
ncbi:transposase [Aliiglaciecola sp. M165]|uniref:transposase n=1 Tax=Aliiglaciecola sp. M165 TaxID=2593649 RepID=UPI00117CD7BD|nr:transposase [Aliiglaciecola sp. M165]TRY29775.1 hypothetical protein FM019_16520 [Aliiglaciecola sp. M165]